MIGGLDAVSIQVFTSRDELMRCFKDMF